MFTVVQLLFKQSFIKCFVRFTPEGIKVQPVHGAMIHDEATGLTYTWLPFRLLDKGNKKLILKRFINLDNLKGQTL